MRVSYFSINLTRVTKYGKKKAKPISNGHEEYKQDAYD